MKHVRQKADIIRVTKLWGEEQWIVNGAYCGKRMVLKAGWQCSLHYHMVKDETFYVEQGVILFEHGGGQFVLRSGDSVHIPPWTRHRFGGMTDAVFFEFSSHHDDADTYRLEESKRMPPVTIE